MINNNKLLTNCTAPQPPKGGFYSTLGKTPLLGVGGRCIRI